MQFHILKMELKLVPFNRELSSITNVKEFLKFLAYKVNILEFYLLFFLNKCMFMVKIKWGLWNKNEQKIYPFTWTIALL